MSRREDVLDALLARLETVSGAEVRRHEALPTVVPAGGLLILRDGDPGEPEYLHNGTYYFPEHRAAVEVFWQGATPNARDGGFDTLLEALAAALHGDRTLGGLVDWVEGREAEPEEVPIKGAEGIRAASVPVILSYATDASLAGGAP